jgi:hypothetical protein
LTGWHWPIESATAIEQIQNQPNEGVHQINIKNPNKYGGRSVKFTTMNSENFDVREPKGKAFCNTAWA